MRTLSSTSRFTLSLLACTIATLVAFKAWVIGLQRLDDLALGSWLEVWAWVGLWLLAFAAEMSFRRAGLLVHCVVFLPLLYLTSGLLFAYAFFFDSAVERRLSLYDIDLSAVPYFWSTVLPIHGRFGLIAFVLVIHGAAWLLMRRFHRAHVSALLAGFVVSAIALPVWAAQAPRVASPFFDIAHDVHEAYSLPKVASRPDVPPLAPPASLAREPKRPATFSTPFRKVVVVVMETMTAAKLETESEALSSSTFFLRERPHFHEFTHYFPNNQDSRTGLLDMLMSRVVPYEAYTDRDLARYAGLRKLPSLADTFQALGYRTAFAVSQTDLEPVVTELRWDKLITLTPSDVAGARGAGRLCFNPYAFEHSCEDLVLLPQVVRFLTESDQAFVFQEMIWGHASEYNEASGWSNADYYSRYLDQLTAELERHGLADETLIAITSDHGFRDKGLQDQLAVYRIPLMFHARRFARESDASLRSHIEFADLLLSTLALAPTKASDNDVVAIVGPTGTGMVAAVTPDELVLLKARSGAWLLLAQHARRDRVQADTPTRVARMFEDYRAAFDRRLR